MAFVSKNENFKETFVYFNVKNQIKFALKYTNVRYVTEKADTPGPAYNLICFENIGAGIVIQDPLLIGVIGKLAPKGEEDGPEGEDQENSNGEKRRVARAVFFI